MRQKSESRNVGYNKTKHIKFSEKLEKTYVCVSGG